MISASVVMLTYNQQAYAADAVRSIMAQDYRPLQVVIADDCSRDGTVAEIEAVLAQAPANLEVILLRNPTNLGIVANLNAAFAKTTGDFVVLAAGDDISAPDRVSRLAEEFVADPRTMAIMSYWHEIDESGRQIDQDDDVSYMTTDTNQGTPAELHTVLGAALAIRRHVLDVFGLLPGTLMAEDHVLTFRAAILGFVVIVPMKLVKYRVHEGNTSPMMKSALIDSTVRYKAYLKYYLTHRQVMAAQRVRDWMDAKERKLSTPSRLDHLGKFALNEAEDIDMICDLHQWKLRGIGRLVYKFCAGRIKFKDATRTAVSMLFPGIWVAYLRWRRPVPTL